MVFLLNLFDGKTSQKRGSIKNSFDQCFYCKKKTFPKIISRKEGGGEERISGKLSGIWPKKDFAVFRASWQCCIQSRIRMLYLVQTDFAVFRPNCLCCIQSRIRMLYLVQTDFAVFRPNWLCCIQSRLRILYLVQTDFVVFWLCCIWPLKIHCIRSCSIMSYQILFDFSVSVPVWLLG